MNPRRGLRQDTGAVLVISLAVVVMLSLAVHTASIWVGVGVGAVARAERDLVVEESLIAAVRIATIDRRALGEEDCPTAPSRSYPINGLEVVVTCGLRDGSPFFLAEVESRWARAVMAPRDEEGQRWRPVHWEWSEEIRPSVIGR